MGKFKKIMIYCIILLIFILFLFSIAPNVYASTSKTYRFSSNRGPRLKYDVSNSKMVTISVIDNNGISSILVEQYLNKKYVNITSKLKISEDKTTISIPNSVIKDKIIIRIKAVDKKDKNYSVNMATITKNENPKNGEYYSLNLSPRFKIVYVPCNNKDNIDAFIIQAEDGNKILQCELEDLNNSNNKQTVKLQAKNKKEFVSFELNTLKLKKSYYYIVLYIKDGKGYETVERIKFNIIESKESTPKYIAHRGASLEFPENTLDAFKSASQNANIFGVETDIRCTSDKQLICMHDSTIDRLTDGTGSVSNLNYENYISKLNVKAIDEKKYKIATYEEYLETIKNSNSNAIIELKSNNKEAINKTIQMIEANKMEKRTIIISFDYEILKYIRTNLNQNIKLCFLVKAATEQNILKAKELNNSMIGINGNSITQEFIDKAHNNNLEVNTWTVDSYTERAKLYYMGVDYITTNNMNT